LLTKKQKKQSIISSQFPGVIFFGISVKFMGSIDNVALRVENPEYRGSKIDLFENPITLVFDQTKKVV